MNIKQNQQQKGKHLDQGRCGKQKKGESWFKIRPNKVKKDTGINDGNCVSTVTDVSAEILNKEKYCHDVIHENIFPTYYNGIIVILYSFVWGTSINVIPVYRWGKINP